MTKGSANMVVIPNPKNVFVIIALRFGVKCSFRLTEPATNPETHISYNRFREREVRLIPMASRIIAGQNVRPARTPNPTGFGLGSRVSPSFAAMMISSNGPEPNMRSPIPIRVVQDLK
jgi:hypothetical protein